MALLDSALVPVAAGAAADEAVVEAEAEVVAVAVVDEAAEVVRPADEVGVVDVAPTAGSSTASAIGAGTLSRPIPDRSH